MSRKFINPLPTGGIPITNEDFLMIQDESLNGIEAICEGIGSNFVINGCQFSIVADDIFITSGYVYIDGEVLKFNGYLGVYPAYIQKNTVTESRVFADGFTKDVINDISAIADTSTGVGGTILFNGVTQPNTMKDVITQNVEADITTIEGDVTTIQADVTSNSVKIANSESDIVAIESDITTLQNQASTLYHKTVNIGSFSPMANTFYEITINTSVDKNKIRGLNITIYTDDGSVLFNHNDFIVQWYSNISSTQLILTYIGSSTKFDEPISNRGYITFSHVL